MEPTPRGRRTVVTMLFLMCISLGAVETDRGTGHGTRVETRDKGKPPRRPLRVYGSPEFKERVHFSLGLLDARAPEFARFVREEISRIDEKPSSLALVWQTGDSVCPTIALSTTRARRSASWCAGALVHEAQHFVSHREDPEHLRRNPTDFELDAFAAELGVLKRLGASPEEIEEVESADGTHWDRDRNGEHTFDDMQDWYRALHRPSWARRQR